MGEVKSATEEQLQRLQLAMRSKAEADFVHATEGAHHNPPLPQKRWQEHCNDVVELIPKAKRS